MPNDRLDKITHRHLIVYGTISALLLLICWAIVMLVKSPAAQEAGDRLGSTKSAGQEPTELAQIKQKLARLEAELGEGGDSKGNGSRMQSIRLDRQEKQARSRARLQTVRMRAQEIQATVDALERELTAWETQLVGVLKGDPGKQLAGDRNRVEQFGALYEKPRLERDGVRALRNQLSTLLEPVEAAVKRDDAYLPSSGLMEDMEKVFQSAKDALREYEQARVAIQTLLADSAHSKPADKTLSDALDDLRAEQARDRVARVTATRKAAYEKATKELAAHAEALEKELAEVEKKQATAMQETEKFKREQLIAAEKKARERKQLEASFEKALPEIKQLLAPFLEKGNKQPAPWGGFMHVEEYAPVSFGRLQSGGYLEKTEDAARLLGRLVSSDGNGNDRKSKWLLPSVPPSRWSEETLKRIQRAQELITGFGPLMVEKKMLSP
jgi:hypothetical protein